MTDILWTTFSKQFYQKNILTLIQISLQFADPVDPTDNNSVLVQAMTWHQTGDRPLSESMMTLSICLTVFDKYDTSDNYTQIPINLFAIANS